MNVLTKFENKPFFKTFDDLYNQAIFNLYWQLRCRMHQLERDRCDRNERRKRNEKYIIKEPLYFNKPKVKHLINAWKTIKSCEKFFKMLINEKTSTTPLALQ